jgi:hypothetical protein
MRQKGKMNIMKSMSNKHEMSTNEKSVSDITVWKII